MIKLKKLTAVLMGICILCAAMIQPVSAAVYKQNTKFDLTTNVTEEHVEIVQKAFADLCGVDYQPIALLGTQVVAGMNYVFLCESHPVVPNPKISLCVVTIYQDLQGNCKATSVKKMDINKLKTTKVVKPTPDDPMYQLCGGMGINPELKQMQVPKKVAGYVDTAMADQEETEYSAIALLGTRKTEKAVYYKVLCSANIAENAQLHAVVVKVTNNGKVTRTALRQFDLGSYR